ncbi:isoprenylcysteine carboxylmethyltransferase family protein [Devosia sp. YIM 151766]|uniref:methyltransferase family protein n=1 Tax=Devosia sp. YIM 151766 TaxID=3017325 RepID=UPI00255CA8ED|nr:isoprenylcysteine carboxylmethyltransferase family protein [Devosia sp. YIM 151766]WIY53746.1 isoprenylcysteine carboxylmethyltransferase family protein [Devosia sp. YIM 151766]
METLFDGLVTLTGMAVVGAYIWSVRNHFQSDAMPPGARIIAAAVTASTIIMLALTWLSTQPILAQVVGLMIQLFSVWIFCAAIMASRQARLRFVFDPEHPHSLVDQGPYRLVRHPFYVSYSIFWFGWAMASWSLLAIPSVVILLWLYIAAARMEESHFEASPLSADYAAYKLRTGFFLPKLG